MGNFLIGLKVTAIGFSTVFVVLTLLMFIIQISGNFMAGLVKKTEAAPKVVPTAPTAAAAAPVKQDDSELVAVIAAAIAACGSTKTIKSITRVNGTAGAAWTVAGRTEVMNRL